MELSTILLYFAGGLGVLVAVTLVLWVVTALLQLLHGLYLLIGSLLLIVGIDILPDTTPPTDS